MIEEKMKCWSIPNTNLYRLLTYTYRYSRQYGSLKAPTTVLIQPDGKTLEAFGYEAEIKYTELVESDTHHPYYYFERFKMMLHDVQVYNKKFTVNGLYSSVAILFII